MDALIIEMLNERKNRVMTGIATALDLAELQELEQLVGEYGKEWELTDLFRG